MMTKFLPAIVLAGLLAISVPTDAFAARKKKKPKAPAVVTALSDVCKSNVKSGWLWKPSSDHSGQPREGRPLILFPKNKPDKTYLAVYASNGKSICRFKRYSEENKYGRRFYSGTGCKKSAKEIETLAKKATGGNKNIYVEADGKGCVGPISPRDRKDKR